MSTMDSIVETKGLCKRLCIKHHRAAKIGLKTLAHELVYLQRPPPRTPLRSKEIWALRDINLTIRRGEAIGIIGENGCGKTTLARVLAGIYKPDSGSVIIRGKVAAIFAKGAGFANNLSGRENIFINMSLLGLSHVEVTERFKEVVAFADLPEGALEAPVRTYSSGMRARLAFSCAVHINPDLMIIDEALAVGDLQFRTKCYNRLGQLKRQGMSFVVVSHNLKGLAQICERAVFIQKGRVIADGPGAQIINSYRLSIKSQTADSAFIPVSVQDGRVEKVRIDNFYFLDAHGLRITSMTHGSRVRFVLECTAEDDAAAVTMSAIVKDVVGEMGTIVTMDSSASGQKWDLKAGNSYKLVINLADVRLAPGEYVLKIILSGGKYHNLLDAIERFNFEVTGDCTEKGLFTQTARLVGAENRAI